ncbi:hypothetical protein [Fulvivirga lutea]|uniref:Uncharacterized protein n=1 Tax=Fulvivirga lutea TaxID=2810512 RepID=A0A975A109_9BACT|nr:hypothetical protein [Fulvivirga lutea]QSE97376.1 hypothetical protein JR347_17610 [Fulvivirga lutea]
MKAINKDYLFSIFILFILILVLFWGILNTYAYTDVYEFILNAKNDNFINVFIQGGRLLYGVLIKSIFSQLSLVEHLKYVRLFSLFGGFILLTVLYQVLRFYKVENIYALAITVLFACSPSFNIIIIWAATFQVSWALLIALIAGYIAVEFKSNTSVFVSITLGIVALNLYQPAFTFFIIPVFIKWLTNRDSQILLKPLIVHVVTYVFYFITYKFYLFGLDLKPLERGGIEYNIVYDVLHFIAGPLKKSLSYNLIFVSRTWMKVIAAFSLIVIIINYIDIKTFSSKLRSKNVAITITIASVFFVFSMLPNVISLDKWISFRSMSTLFLLVIIHIIFALSNGLKNCSFKLQLVSISLLMIGSIFSAYYNINHGFISIQTAEFEIVKSEVSKISDDKSMVYIKPASMNSLAEMGYIKRVVTDEFGRFSTSSDWVPIPIVKMALDEKIRENVRVEVYGGQPLKENEILVDIEKEFKERYWR